MNKTALKNFATWSRRKLIEQVQTKAFLYGIDEKNGLLMEEQFGQLVINGQTYPLSMKSSFTALQKQLEQKGYKQLLEEVAYTWFNRIIAIRYMEVHEYLPEKVNVLSSSVGRVDPDILFEYDTMELAIDEAKVRELVNAGDTEAAFRLLFVAQCNALNTILPFMFEKIQDYTELLLPDFLLDAESVIKTLVQSEELTESFEEIEVIGWLYQYYIAEEKDRVFAQKSKYKKEEIPFATQLFTPKWIVQYMVQNSLGRYWTEAHREDEDLIDQWEYFIKHEEEDFHEKIAQYVNKELRVEDIKLLDPAMGSGHILVYAFEVFHEIYEKCGYPEREIPRLILENNLYGLDIDDRAYQLASFAVVMKAASYSKRFLRNVEREGITLNLASIQETNHVSDDVIAYIAQQEVGEQYNQVKAFFEQYYNAKTYGSLINITEREINFIEERFEQIGNNPVHDLFYGEQHEIAQQVLPALIHQTKIMRNEYDVVVMNPPYMGNSNMSKELGDFLKVNYPKSKSDLFAAFMDCDNYLKQDGFNAMITMESWMFLNSYQKLRGNIIENFTVLNLIHMPYEGKGRTSLGINFGTAAFILRKCKISSINGIYQSIRHFEINEGGIPLTFPIINEKYNQISQNEFKLIPESRFTYWANKEIINVFQGNKQVVDFLDGGNGMTTGINESYLRYWFEVEFNKIKFNATNPKEAKESEKKWFPYIKGGAFNKWYGNLEYVINWENDGQEIRTNGRSFLRNEKYYFKEGLSWSKVTSGKFSVRYSPKGCLFDVGGLSLFAKDNFNIYDFIGYLNSSVAEIFISSLSQSMNYESGTIKSLPYKKANNDTESLVSQAIEISKYFWDINEISWDYKKNHLINKSDLINDALIEVKKELLEYKERLLVIENELGNIYSETLKIKKPSIDSKIVLDFEEKIEIKKLLSYFVGCIFGRYSFFDPNEKNIIGDFGLIQLTETKYFEKDIVEILKVFLSKAFSSQYVDENMLSIAEKLQLKAGENPEERIRRYFLDEFFVDHCKMYQKRPIYWLVDSGKQKGLRTLIYMHRYTPSTMATIRFEHLQEIQGKYQQEIADIENRLVNPNLSATDKKKLNAEKVSFEKKVDELREFDKRLAAIAAEEIEIDLDDGVKVNYEKFYRGGKGVLAKIK